ncbi:MAG: MmgE/PrpD family protein [Chloroflexi bacterium]|nr:MmgE/PrpD family protein [Chloroflexota bacterium]
MTVSETLADFLLGLEFGGLPSDTVASAGKLLLDHLCVALAGSFTPWGQATWAAVRQFGGAPESSIYFSREKLPATSAAFVNGTFAHALELDDQGGIGMHPGAVVIPAALAAGQRRGVDGRTFITAMVSGYEVLYRLSAAMGSISALGHHPTGTMGAFGAAAAAGKVLGLGRDPMVSALGLAGNFPAGVQEFYDGTSDVRLLAGRAAESGVLCCLLAEAGVTGARTILEGEGGLCRSFSRHVDLDKIPAGLGEKFHTGEFRIKRYPCAGWNHPYVETAIRLRNSPGIAGDTGPISAIIIEGRRLDGQRARLDVPNGLAGQYSIPYAVASTLRRSPPAASASLDQAVGDAEVQYLVGRSRCVRREDYPGIGRVTVRLENGTTLTEEVVDTEKPVSEVDRQDILNKAEGAVAPFLGLETGRDAVNALDGAAARIGDSTDIREAMELIPELITRAPVAHHQG